ncbi:MAG: hypothetical protein V3V08_06260 [Nannocystaceae bacterium]
MRSLDPPRARLTADVAGGYFGYIRPWNVDRFETAVASIGVTLPSGVGVWAGAGFAQAHLRYAAQDFWQANPVAGMTYGARKTYVGASASWLFTSAEEIQHTKVLAAYADYAEVWFGGGLGLSSSIYPDLLVLVAHPRLHIASGKNVRATVGAKLTLLRGEPDTAQNGTEFLPSGTAALSWVLGSRLTLSGGGFAGPQAYTVSDGGLWVWASSDRFAGGYFVGGAVVIGKKASYTLGASFSHRFGQSQAGLAHDFQILGGTITGSAAF